MDCRTGLCTTPEDSRRPEACRGSIPGCEGGEGIVTQEIDKAETRCIITTQAVRSLLRKVSRNDHSVQHPFRVRSRRSPSFCRNSYLCLGAALRGYAVSDSQWKDQYRNPLWQKRRLEVMQYRDFTCQVCGDTSETLNVHHKAYIKGRKVWEYENDQLECLCETCHKTAHDEKEKLLGLLLLISSEGIGSITALVAGYCSTMSGPVSIDVCPQELESLAEKDALAFASGRIGGLSQLEHYKSRARIAKLNEAEF